MNRRNPQCCCVSGCCELIVVKPLPTRNVVGGVVSYDATLWNASYVSGISGTTNTIPANTTISISVPIGCTDYIVDVEVLDDSGQSVTNLQPGLVIKVGESLQAANVLRAVNHDEIYQSGDTSFIYEEPTIFSQHHVETVNRTPNKVRPFYGDNYCSYRFYEVFHSAAMNSGVIGYRHPDFRSDVPASHSGQVNTSKLPPDAGGQTVSITIETGNQPVEIGLIQVHAGHIGCASINAVDFNIPIDTPSPCTTAQYTIKDPSSYVYNNATSRMTSSMNGNVRTIGGCASTGCTYDYQVDFDYPQWNGNNAWLMKWNDISGYFSRPDITDYHETGVYASGLQIGSLMQYLGKCDQHNWVHADRLVDWRQYEWVEPELNAASYSVAHTLTITGTCNIVAETQANIDADLNAARNSRIYPSGGPLLTEQNNTDSVPCPEPAWCTGDPQLVYKNIQHTTFPAIVRKWLKPIMHQEGTQFGQTVKSFWSLPVAFAYPNAKASATPSDDYNFTRSAIPSYVALNCGFTYSRNLVDVDLTESATIVKIPYYGPTDPDYTLIGGAGFDVIPTRDQHLINLQLYIASETDTFTASTGLTMQYTALNASTTRPNYATCGCPCTADELYQDDLYGFFCAKYHRWMEFTGTTTLGLTDTWFIQWYQQSNPTYWTFFLRRQRDCKEITFTNVPSAIPNTESSVTKSATNAGGDTLQVAVQA